MYVCTRCNKKTNTLSDGLCPECYRKEHKLDGKNITYRDASKYRRREDHDRYK